MKPLFIVTSAINTRFGAYSPDQRLLQTIDTVKSIGERCPEAKVCIVEMAGVPIREDQARELQRFCNYFFDFSSDEAVKTIYESTDNWDWVKNTTEVMCFANALTELQNQGVLAEFDRVFKMSGRYCLTEKFPTVNYDDSPNNIVILERKGSQFPAHITGGKQFQYMSRLWSWPANESQKVIDAYNEGFAAMAQHIHNGGYFDIEHMLYAYLPSDLVKEIPTVGLRGLLGPTGATIED
jgi:hypothetical protein